MMKGAGSFGRIRNALVVGRDLMLVEILATIQDKEPDYTRFESIREEDAWAETAAWLLDLFLELATESRWLNEAEEQRIRSVGRTRRGQAFDLGAMKRAVRAAVAVVRARVLEQYPGGDDGSEGDELLALLDRFGNAVENLLHEGFDAKRGVRADDHSAMLVQDVVDHRVRSAQDLLRRASDLGCATTERAVLMTADLSAADNIASSLARVHVARRSTGRVTHALLVVPVPEVGWQTTIDHIRALARQAGATLLVAGPTSDLGDLYDRYICGLPLVPYLHTMAEHGDVIQDTDVELAAIMAALPRDARQAFARRVLGSLESCDEETAAKHLAHLDTNINLGFSAVAIAKTARLHKTSVYRRHNRFTETVGRSLMDAHDQAVLTLARHATRLEG